jgi:hypothetical protein
VPRTTVTFVPIFTDTIEAYVSALSRHSCVLAATIVCLSSVLQHVHVPLRTCTASPSIPSCRTLTLIPQRTPLHRLAVGRMFTAAIRTIFAARNATVIVHHVGRRVSARTVAPRFARRCAMSANQYEKSNGENGNATAVTSTPVRLREGSVTRFLSADYPIPFAPLTKPLSFNDLQTWPQDPMQVFSQWYAQHADLTPCNMIA